MSFDAETPGVRVVQIMQQDDFDVVPIFGQAGGWGKANRVFGGRLAEVLQEINAALAA